MADESSRILDLLFDQNDGVLKEEVPEIHTIDFSSLGLMTGDFDDFLLDGSLFKDDITQQKKLAQRQADTYTDHDYVLQKSPAHSDSGISLDSGSSSPRLAEDQSHVYSDVNSLSDSPRSVSQLSTHMSENQSEFSPTMVDQSESSPLGLEDFDMSDINFDNLDTIDSSALEDGGGLDLLDTDDVSIDVGMHSDLMTFDTSTIPTQNADGTTTKMIKIVKVAPQAKTNTLPFTMKDVSTPQQGGTSNFPDLRLTDEEQELLAREGVVLPTNMPLTKEEERQLKAVRRKIRNKISAKESRKRKMDYVGGLEKRVKLCTQENQHLQKKVQDLEQKNVSLVSQLKKLQSLIALKTTKTAQASTCVMVLLLSFAFLIVPNFNPFGSKDSSSEVKSILMPGKSRSLLHTSGNTANDANNPYGLTMRPAAPWEMSKTPVVPKVDGAFPTPSEDMLDELSEKKVDISPQKMDILDTNISTAGVGGSETVVDTKRAQKQEAVVVPNQRQDL